MSDIALDSTTEGFDIELQGADLKQDSGLKTAALISLGIQCNEDRSAGWWGATDDPTLLGSRTYHVAKNSESDRSILQDRIKESLRWMVEDKLAGEIETVLNEASANEVRVTIPIFYPRENQDEKVEFYWRSQLENGNPNR